MAGPAAIAAVPWLMYAIFSVITVLAVPFVYFCIPETRGLSLEELDFVFMDGPVRLSGKRNKAEHKRRIAAGQGADAEANRMATRHIHDFDENASPSDGSVNKEIANDHVEFTEKE